MGFVDRVKEILLKRNEEEISGIDQKITELQDTYYQKSETVNKLKEESDVVSKERKDVQKYILNKKELAESKENLKTSIKKYIEADFILENGEETKREVGVMPLKKLEKFVGV